MPQQIRFSFYAFNTLYNKLHMAKTGYNQMCYKCSRNYKDTIQVDLKGVLLILQNPVLYNYLPDMVACFFYYKPYMPLISNLLTI